MTKTSAKKYLSAIKGSKIRNLTCESLSRSFGKYPEMIAQDLSIFEPMLMMDMSGFDLRDLVEELEKFIEEQEANKPKEAQEHVEVIHAEIADPGTTYKEVEADVANVKALPNSSNEEVDFLIEESPLEIDIPVIPTVEEETPVEEEPQEYEPKKTASLPLGTSTPDLFEKNMPKKNPAQSKSTIEQPIVSFFFKLIQRSKTVEDRKNSNIYIIILN